MANKKLFNSKNISVLLETLIDAGKVDLVMQILQLESLKGLLPNILGILKRKNIKLADYEQVKIFSKTELSEDMLKEVQETLKINSAHPKIIIDESMGAGVKIKTRDRLIDASLSSMLQKGIEELLGGNKK